MYDFLYDEKKIIKRKISGFSAGDIYLSCIIYNVNMYISFNYFKSFNIGLYHYHDRVMLHIIVK